MSKLLEIALELVTSSYCCGCPKAFLTCCITYLRSSQLLYCEASSAATGPPPMHLLLPNPVLCVHCCCRPFQISPPLPHCCSPPVDPCVRSAAAAPSRAPHRSPMLQNVADKESCGAHKNQSQWGWEQRWVLSLACSSSLLSLLLSFC
jgi:hypothetical protein